MISRHDHSQCEKAREYYFEYLESSSRWTIPGAILTHLATCDHCRVQVDRLDEAVGAGPAASGDWKDEQDDVTIDLLSHHLAYADSAVTCTQVKPFLPSLADPELEIRIPTPITAHVDRCEQCRADVATLRSLQLSGRQLHRLSRLLMASGGAVSHPCTHAAAPMASMADLRFEGIDPETLDGLCACPDCRSHVFHLRSQRLDELHADGQGCKACPGVSSVDLFDYVLPYGLALDADRSGKFRQSLSDHVRQCPTCMAAIQELHQQVFGMAARGNSDVMTYYSIPRERAAQPGESSVSRAEAEYEDRDGVEEAAAAPATGQESDSPVRLEDHRRVTGHRVKIVAAAVLFVVIGLAVTLSPARAVSLGEVIRAVGRIQNLHVEMFSAGNPRPVQEYWVSKDMGLLCLKVGGAVTCWDLGSRKHRVLDPALGTISERPLLQDELAAVQGQVSTAFGMLPFDNPQSVPAGAHWTEVKVGQVGTKGSEIHELEWTEPSALGGQISRRWWVTVNSRTGLPQRAEFYSRGPLEADYSPETVMTVQELSRSQMQAVLEALSVR
jgi:hypothetical protein